MSEKFSSGTINHKQTISAPGFVKCGVPQGNILGPLFYDMTSSIDPNYKVILYVDGIAILFTHKNKRPSENIFCC